MSTKRSFTLALALLLVAAMPARATTPPTLTVIDTINPGAGSSYAMHYSDDSVALGDFLYFGAIDATHGRELWRTNGTTTELVMDINTGSSGADSSDPDYLTAYGAYLYFRADDGTHGFELWRTDGTTTELVQDINTGSSGADDSDPGYLAALGDYLYFQATDGTHSYELWRTNGTTTELVQDIYTGTDGSGPYYLTALSGYLYFSAIDATHGRELWRTDGTTTELVMDINHDTVGVDDSDPYAFTALGDFLYFAAIDATHGDELWRTDGTVTERVPFPVAGQNITSCSCDEMSIVAVGGRLYTTVYSSDIGHEFAYLDEPTDVLPPTNRGGSVWTTTLVILAGLTAAAATSLRLREAKRS